MILIIVEGKNGRQLSFIEPGTEEEFLVTRIENRGEQRRVHVRLTRNKLLSGGDGETALDGEMDIEGRPIKLLIEVGWNEGGTVRARDPKTDEPVDIWEHLPTASPSTENPSNGDDGAGLS